MLSLPLPRHHDSLGAKYDIKDYSFVCLVDRTGPYRVEKVLWSLINVNFIKQHIITSILSYLWTSKEIILQKNETNAMVISIEWY